jgi:hypothetical protein
VAAPFGEDTPLEQRRQLAAQLVRAQALLWSSEDAGTKLRLHRVIEELETRIEALEAIPDPWPKEFAYEKRRA